MLTRQHEVVFHRLDVTVEALPRLVIRDACHVLRTAVCAALVELGAQALCREVLVEVLDGGVLHLRLTRAVAGALGLHDPEVRASMAAGAWPALRGMVGPIVGGAPLGRA